MKNSMTDYNPFRYTSDAMYHTGLRPLITMCLVGLPGRLIHWTARKGISLPAGWPTPKKLYISGEIRQKEGQMPYATVTFWLPGDHPDPAVDRSFAPVRQVFTFYSNLFVGSGLGLHPEPARVETWLWGLAKKRARRVSSDRPVVELSPLEWMARVGSAGCDTSG